LRQFLLLGIKLLVKYPIGIKNKLFKKNYFLFILPLLALGILESCENNEQENVEESIGIASQDLTVVTQEQFDIELMELGPLVEKDFHDKVNTTGVLEVPPENKSTVSAYFGGYIKNIALLPGQKVTKGETLFILENPEYIEIQRDFLETKSTLNYLELDYKRQMELAQDNISSQKTFLKAESDYKVALVKYELLKMKLSLMNINSNSITETNLRSTIPVKSLISGYITNVDATKGMFLNPSDRAVTIMNTDHIHIELSIFEQDLMKIKVGQEVTFKLQNDVTVYEANIHLINKVIESQKRTINVHCHLKNEEESKLFTPGMYLEAEILTTSKSAMALPENAIVNIEDSYYVLVSSHYENNGHSFEKREVKIGSIDNGFIEVLNVNEFDNNATFLINGAFNLITE
jgi:cobalt-zinc-cadmium efflux system membrane fusion protein